LLHLFCLNFFMIILRCCTKCLLNIKNLKYIKNLILWMNDGPLNFVVKVSFLGGYYFKTKFYIISLNLYIIVSNAQLVKLGAHTYVTWNMFNRHTKVRQCYNRNTCYIHIVYFEHWNKVKHSLSLTINFMPQRSSAHCAFKIRYNIEFLLY
jgi:hypothetical protein